MHINYYVYNMIVTVVEYEKIKLATDQRFSCYDREEVSISLKNYDYMRMGY